MSFSRNALGRRINIGGPSFYQDVGRLDLMFHEALVLLGRTIYTSPRWETQPEQDQVEWEEQNKEQSELAEKELRLIARDIYQALTGRIVVQDREG